MPIPRLFEKIYQKFKQKTPIAELEMDVFRLTLKEIRFIRTLVYHLNLLRATQVECDTLIIRELILEYSKEHDQNPEYVFKKLMPIAMGRLIYQTLSVEIDINTPDLIVTSPLDSPIDSHAPLLPHYNAIVGNAIVSDLSDLKTRILKVHIHSP